jgi:hypothetical protein
MTNVLTTLFELGREKNIYVYIKMCSRLGCSNDERLCAPHTDIIAYVCTWTALSASSFKCV